MNIKQALKRKNKLVTLISEEFSKASTYNSIEEGNARPYSATEALQKWQQYSDELVSLKSRIHRANAPVYDKIFMMSELKSQIKHLRSLNCAQGKERNRWNENEPIIRHAEINTVERDTMVKDMEARIELIQDELDKFNTYTEI